ncbi:hypothetical protein PsorP6_007650 [Peronosclerospora sorghi]|uniref:Uncharacterized protein n=1 Tax=Peronosclerospora sorghi TaxID=230839 RepID=A0ACC0WAH7_9STRA|nr:hypothetical protein PsorP6_007650 [Peronosclerospora sorghi]
MRILVCVNGNLYNVHLVVVPFLDRHTAENTVKLITTLLETVCAPWQDKIIAITTDGENTNTGWRNGVLARLNRMATHQLMRVWCAPHQGDIVIRAATNEMDNGAFYKKAHAFSVHLRQQHNLILEIQVQYPPADNVFLSGSYLSSYMSQSLNLDMQVLCPRDTNRWMYFERILSFMLKHRRRLEQWIEEKRPVSAPSPTWWLMCASVQPLAELCNTTMTILQSHDMILCQQMAEIKSLIGHLVTAMDVEADGNPHDDFVTFAGNTGSKHRVCGSTFMIRDHGPEICSILFPQKTNRMCCMKLVNTLCNSFAAERDERNNAGSIVPPVLPAQLVKLRTGTFISDVLDKYRAHIGLYWSAEDVEQVEADHRVNDVGLVKAYNQEPSTKALIDEHTLKTNFNDVWASIGNRFTFLRRFSGGLAVAFANTTSVESDFSVLKWENDNFRQSMTNLTLEGIFQLNTGVSLIP